jgi:hypothetical protein
MNQFKQYEKYKKSLNKKDKCELLNSIFFLRTAMTSTMTIEVVNNYSDYTDDNGWAEFYEIVMEICDEILLSNDSVFLRYIELYINGDEEATLGNYFDSNFGTCYDWYFMDRARESFSERMVEELGE